MRDTVKDAPVRPINRQTLSLCMIVKNEEAHLSRCLESVKGVTDEIIIVDTGSTDRTLDIARQYGAKVALHRWNDDFAAARNVSLSHATSDWILVLDADEALAEEDKGRLCALLRPDGPTAYLLNIASPVDDSRSRHAVINAFPRLFRSQPEIRFEGRVHEQVSPSIARMGGSIGPSEIRVHHTGYHGAWVDLPAKRQRNIRLLKRQLTDHPEDPSAQFHLGEVYALEGKVGEAIACYRTALSLRGLPPANRSVARRSLAACLLNRGRFEEAWQECVAALEEDQGYAMPHLTGALALGRLGRYEAAIRQIDLYLDKVSRQGRGIHGVLGHISNPAYARSLKGNYLFALGQVDRAADCYTAALADDPDSPEAHLGMGKVHKLRGQAQDAAASLEKAATLFERIPHGRLTLAECYAELGKWTEVLAACEQFLQACPDDKGGLELQAQALLKLNRLTEAEVTYRRLVTEAPSAMAYFALACLADGKSNRKEAARFCRKAWELERSDARIPFLLGCCLIEAGEYREALDALLEAERLAPGTPEIERRLRLLARFVQRERHEVGTPPTLQKSPQSPLYKRGDAGGFDAEECIVRGAGCEVSRSSQLAPYRGLQAVPLHTPHPTPHTLFSMAEDGRAPPPLNGASRLTIA